MKKIQYYLYRSFCKSLARQVSRFYFSKDRYRGIPNPHQFQIPLAQNSLRKRYWFHASSVGELEMLWPLTQRLADRNSEFIITVFSQSAIHRLKQLDEELQRLGSKIIYFGYCPWEGDWSFFLRTFKPSCFIAARYDAWPDLWVSLTELNIPLIVIGARVRSSLIIAKKFCLWMTQRLPRLVLIAQNECDAKNLREVFPKTQIEILSDPRWDRVFDRIKNCHPRVEVLEECFSEFCKPWGFLAQIWSNDIEIWSKELEQISAPACIWFIPHQVDSAHVDALESSIQELCFKVVRTSWVKDLSFQDQDEFKKLVHKKDQKIGILVDEIGFLTELYRLADWVYVGGGFGAGIHSTLEPAIYGLPIAGGPSRSQEFSEIGELSALGQFVLVKNDEELSCWVRRLKSLTKPSVRNQWRMSLDLKKGSATQASHLICNFLSSN